MKKFLLLLGAATALGVSAADPVIMQTSFYDLSVIASDFTISKQNLIVSEQYSADDSHKAPIGFKVYNGNLEKIADILVPVSKTETYTYYRKGPWSDTPDEYTITEPLSEPTPIYNQKDGIESDGFYLTQNLFNSDSQFEYVLANKKKLEASFEDGSEKFYGEFMAIVGYTVMSQNDSKILEITLPDGYYSTDKYVFLLPIEERYYFVVSASDNCSTQFYTPSATYYTIFYELDSKGGIQAPKIVEGRMNVSPVTPRHGETINVDLGSEANGATVVNVVSTNGSIVRSQPVNAGQRNVSLQTAGLASGLYVVTANGHEAAKIIIR